MDAFDNNTWMDAAHFYKRSTCARSHPLRGVTRLVGKLEIQGAEM